MLIADGDCADGRSFLEDGKSQNTALSRSLALVVYGK